MTAHIVGPGGKDPNANVDSVFGRTGTVTATSGDYTAAQVTNAADKSSGATQVFAGGITSGNNVTLPSGGQLIVAGNSSATNGLGKVTAYPTTNSPTYWLASGLASDTVNRFIADANGKLYWGPGGNGAVDTNLYRSAAGTLKMDGNSGGAGNDALQIAAGDLSLSNGKFSSVRAAGSVFNGWVTAEGNPRITLSTTINGIQFGPGSAALDTNLYRQGVGVLQTDGSLAVGAADAAQLTVRSTGQPAAFFQGDSTRSASNQLVLSANRYGQSGGFQLYGDHHMVLGTSGNPVTVSTGGIVTQSGVATAAITSGALPTVSPSSGTPFQCSTTRDVFLVVPITFTLIASTLKVELSPDNSTFTTLVTKAPNLAGAVDEASLQVPAGWYVKLTATNATLGTGVYY